MRSRSSQSGFTLTEVLVVIAIIGILASISIPAVMSAYETARKTTCANNLRNLGVALEGYHANKDNFPPSFYTRTHPTAATNHIHNWVVALLPYLEQEKMADDLKDNPDWIGLPSGANNAMIDVQIPMLLCASDVYDNPAGGISYAANCGRIDPPGPVFPGDLTGAADPVPSFRDPNGKGAGIFYDRSSGRSASTKTIKLDKSDVYDGLGQTIMLAERSNPRFGVSTSAAGITDPRWVGSTESLVGLVWRGETFEGADDSVAGAIDLADASTAQNLQTYIGFGQAVNFQKDNNPMAPALVEQIHFARPASLHYGSVNVLFCDSSVQSIDSEISYEVYCDLMTADSREIAAGARGKGVVTTDKLK